MSFFVLVFLVTSSTSTPCDYKCSSCSTPPWNCDTCISAFKVNNICMDFDCSTFETEFLDVEIFLGKFSNWHSNFVSGSDQSTFYPVHNGEADDVLPMLNRGLYYNSARFLKSIHEKNLGPNFSISVWVRPKAGTILRKKNFLVVGVSGMTLELEDYTGAKNTVTVDPGIALDVWQHLAFTSEFPVSDGTKLSYYKNGVPQGSGNFPNKIFRQQPGYFYYIGGNSGDEGFIDYLKLSLRVTTDFTAEHNNYCGASQSGSCLSECEINQYKDVSDLCQDFTSCPDKKLEYFNTVTDSLEVAYKGDSFSFSCLTLGTASIPSYSGSGGSGGSGDSGDSGDSGSSGSSGGSGSGSTSLGEESEEETPSGTSTEPEETPKEEDGSYELAPVIEKPQEDSDSNQFILFLLFGSLFCPSLSRLWSVLNAILIISLIPITNNPLTPFLFDYLRSLNYFEYLPNFMALAFDGTDSPNPHTYSKNYGYSSSLFYLISGEVYLVLAFTVVSWPVAWVLSKSESKYIRRKFKRILGSFKTSVWIRFLLETYVILCIASINQVFYTESLELVNYLSGVGSLILVVGLLVFLAVLCRTKSQEIKTLSPDSEFYRRWSSFFYELRVKESSWAKHYYTLFMLVRLLYACNLLFLQSSPELQVCINIFLMLVFLVFMVGVRPFKSKISQLFNTFGELGIFLVFCIVAYFLKESNSWAENAVYYTTVYIFCCHITASLLTSINIFYKITKNQDSNSKKKLSNLEYPKALSNQATSKQL